MFKNHGLLIKSSCVFNESELELGRGTSTAGAVLGESGHGLAEEGNVGAVHWLVESTAATRS